MGASAFCPHCHKTFSPNCHISKAKEAFYKQQKAYPYNLYKSIFGGAVKKVSSEMEQGLAEALSHLKERERLAIEWRYKDSKKLKDIVEINCVTVTRLHLVCALHRLRTPELLELIIRGWPEGTPKYWEEWK